MRTFLLIAFLTTLFSCSYNATQVDNASISSKNEAKSVVYNCDRNTNITVSFISTTEDNPQKNIAIVNSQSDSSITLPAKPVASGFLYSNGKFSLRGKGSEAFWTVARMMPLKCVVADK